MTKLDGRIMGRKVMTAPRHSATRGTVRAGVAAANDAAFSRAWRLWLACSLAGVVIAAVLFQLI